MAMQESIVVLLHRVLFDESPYETTQWTLLSFEKDSRPSPSSSSSSSPTIESNNFMHQANEGDPAIQLMGMLTCLVCEGGFGNVLVGEVVKSLSDVKSDNDHRSTPSSSITPSSSSSSSSSGLLFSQLQEMSSDSIESFVASGGLRWACGCIVRLVHRLVHRPSSEEGSDANAHPRWKNGAVNDETIQTRLVLLIDLVYRLVLFGTVPCAVDGEGARTSINTTVEGGEENDTNHLDGKPSSTARSASNNNDDAQKKRKRSNNNNLSNFYELMARAQGRGGDIGETATSRTSALRNSIRSTLASRGVTSPPLPGGKDKGGNDDGDNKQVNPDVAEENRLRRERRKATLERVHSVFWKSTLPAAVCVGKNPAREDSMDTDQDELYYGNFSPLACLVAAYEILRSPSTRFDDATNKAISILSRLVDPAAGYCLVVSDPEIPWGLSTLLWGNGRSLDKVEGNTTHETRSRKRDRSASQESQRSRSPHARSVSASLHEALRAKRQRTRRTHIASLLERLSDPSRETRDNPYSPAAALAGSSHYSSLLLRGAGGPSSAASSANRDGSLSRIIAAAEERSGLGEPSSGIRARAVLDRSPGDWRIIDSAAERDDEGVVMMDEDDDNDTEFEQDQEDGPGDEMDDIPDEPDEDEGVPLLFTLTFVHNLHYSDCQLYLPSDGGDDEGDDEDGDEGPFQTYCHSVDNPIFSFSFHLHNFTPLHLQMKEMKMVKTRMKERTVVFLMML